MLREVFMSLEFKHVLIKGRLNNYKLNVDINDKIIIGVFSNDEKAINDFFLKASGVNTNEGNIFFRGYSVFDNKEYFKNRLLINYKQPYITSLDKSYLQKYFKENYNIDIDLNIFEKINKDLKLRNEYLIKDKYIFTKRGLNLVNYSLTKCICKKINFIYNVISNCSKEEREIILLGLADKENFDVNFLDFNDVLVSSKFIDKYLFFSNSGEIVFLTNDDDVYLVGGEILNSLIYNKTKDISITNYEYTKEEIKTFKKRKIILKKIKFIDVERYL